MSSNQDRTPQFYDAHAKRSSPLDHLAQAKRPAPQTATPMLGIATPSKPRRKMPVTLSTAVLLIGLVGGMVSGYFKQANTVQQFPTTIQPDTETPEVQGSIEQQATHYFHAQDYDRAGALYRACAYQGSAECQRSLAYLYSSGLGVTRDDEQAFEWLRKAAEQGNAVAQDDLGVMYGDGRGVQQDWVESFLWISRSAAQGLPQARDDLSYAVQHMTPAQRKEAQTRWEREISER